LRSSCQPASDGFRYAFVMPVSTQNHPKAAKPTQAVTKILL